MTHVRAANTSESLRNPLITFSPIILSVPLNLPCLRYFRKSFTMLILLYSYCQMVLPFTLTKHDKLVEWCFLSLPFFFLFIICLLYAWCNGISRITLPHPSVRIKLHTLARSFLPLNPKVTTYLIISYLGCDVSNSFYPFCGGIFPILSPESWRSVRTHSP